MSPTSPDHPILRRVVFLEGSEYLPGDLPLGLDDIRIWATKSALVSDAETQLVLSERINEIVKVAQPGDELGIAISISKNDAELEYIEYPYLSVRSLIKRDTKLPIVYWRVASTYCDRDGNATVSGEVRFGFWLEGCSDEFCSVSTASRVVEKFSGELDNLSSTFSVQAKPGGSREITVEGAVLASFIKLGRSFDVVLSEKT